MSPGFADAKSVISDVSYIPNFAYESPFGFGGRSGPDSDTAATGINRLHSSEYFKLKDHWSNPQAPEGVAERYSFGAAPCPPSNRAGRGCAV